MSLINKTCILGEVRGDVFRTLTSQNYPLAFFEIVTRDVWVNHEGKECAQDHHHRIKVKGRNADLAETLKPGDVVYIEGPLRYVEMEAGEEGKEVYYDQAQISANYLIVLEGLKLPATRKRKRTKFAKNEE
jgi:single-stranded DNA-binding protein